MDKDGKTFDNEFEIWLRRLSIKQLGNNPDFVGKITKGRREIWEHLMKNLHPTHEVEHIRKVLTLKRLATKMQLKQQLEQKKKKIAIMEHDYEQSSQNLRILNCEKRSIQERTKELGMKTALIVYKKQVLEKKAMTYEKIRDLPYLAKQPANFGSVDKDFSHDNQMDNRCHRAILESHIHLKELHDTYKTNEVDMEELLAKKEAMIEFVNHRMKGLPVVNIWQTMMNIMDQLNTNLHEQIQMNLRNKSQNFFQREQVNAEFNLLLKSFLGYVRSRQNLLKQISQNDSEYNSLLNEAVQLLQENILHKFSKSEEGMAEIRKMLELEMTLHGLNASKIVITNCIIDMKRKRSNYKHVDLQEEETKKQYRELEMLKGEIRRNSMWLTKSYAGLNRTYECLQKEITKLPEMLNKCAASNLNIAMKELESALKKEMKLFMELPLNVFDKAILPSGIILPRCQQTLKYNLHLSEMSESPELPSILTVLSGAPSASPLRVVFEAYENKMYLSVLKAEENNSALNKTDDLDVTSLQNAENFSMAAITDVMESLKTSIGRGTNIAERAEANFKIWVEPPMQHAVPSELKVQEKSFKEWKDYYENLLKRLG